MGSVGVSRWAELRSGSQLPAALLLEQLSHCFPGHILRLGPEKSLRSSSRCSSHRHSGATWGSIHKRLLRGQATARAFFSAPFCKMSRF